LLGETLATLSANATTTSNDGAGETQIQKKTSVPEQIERKTLTRDGEDDRSALNGKGENV
jgi:hypothetical protein